jgi:hypothetical protein
MIVASPGWEMCHAWPVGLPARPDRRRGLCGREPGPLADGSGAPVERARLVWCASQGETPPSMAEALGVSAETVRRRIRRFNAEGLAALEDHHRAGRPAPYSADVIAEAIAAALTSPQRLNLPFASWMRSPRYRGDRITRARPAPRLWRSGPAPLPISAGTRSPWRKPWRCIQSCSKPNTTKTYDTGSG